MLKGIQQQTVLVRTPESPYFEEARFLMRTERGDRFAKEDDLLREANRILEEIGFSSAGKRKKRKGIRRGAWFALGALCGGGGVGLLGLLLFFLI